MKILVASHSYIVDLNREKYRALARLSPEIEVTIAVPAKWRPGGVMKDLVETQPVDEGNFRVVPLSNLSQNNQGLLSFGSDLVKLMRGVRPDIIQVEQGSKSLAYAQMITLNRALNLKAKNLFFTWWNLPYTLKFPVSALEHYNLKHTDGIVVGNQAGYDILRDRGYQKAMTILPQLGVDEELFCPEPQESLRASLSINPETFVIGFVGRFVAEKGLMTLLDAVAGLGERRFTLLLLGRGPLQAAITQKAAQLGLGDRLIQIESVPHRDVAKYIAAMNCLVLPSETAKDFKTMTATGWKEQFGHVLIEAMAAQVPVIGSDSGEIPNVIREGGLVFPEGDGEALRHRLVQLIDQPEFATEIAQAGYRRAMTCYTNRALAKACLDFYRSI
jgi:L-malate glycosyltransferase